MTFKLRGCILLFLSGFSLAAIGAVPQQQPSKLTAPTPQVEAGTQQLAAEKQSACWVRYRACTKNSTENGLSVKHCTAAHMACTDALYK